jgi:hypothetical protein
MVSSEVAEGRAGVPELSAGTLAARAGKHDNPLSEGYHKIDPGALRLCNIRDRPVP